MCWLRLTNVQHTKMYDFYNMFESIGIFKIRIN